MSNTEREAEAALEGLLGTVNPETAATEKFTEEHIIPLMVIGKAIEMDVEVPGKLRDWITRLPTSFLDEAMGSLVKSLKEEFLPLKGRLSDSDKRDLALHHCARLALVRAGMTPREPAYLNIAHHAEFGALWAELQG